MMTPTHQGRFRPLGKNQIEVLRCLEEHGGWHKHGGWNWDTTSNTARICMSMVGRGLVEITEKGYTGLMIGTDRELDPYECAYEITAAGRAENERRGNSANRG